MTKNEQELLTLIHESNDPVKALVIATEIITAYLVQSGSYQSPFVDRQPERV